MTTAIIPNTEPRLQELAAQISSEHRQCEAALKAGLQHAINAGQLLLEAKAMAPHGAWGAWIQDNCDMSERTAQVYMRVARCLPVLGGKAQRVADLSLREAVALLAAPIIAEEPPEGMSELDKAKEFARRADGICAEEGKKIAVLRMAMAGAQTLEDWKAIADLASESREKIAEVRIQAEMECGRIHNDLFSTHTHETVWLWLDAFKWAETHGISSDELLASAMGNLPGVPSMTRGKNATRPGFGP